MTIRRAINVVMAAIGMMGAAVGVATAADTAQRPLPSLSMRDGAVLDLQSGFSEAAPPSERAKAQALARVASYAKALAARDFAAAYFMLRLSYQAANPKIHWEMNLRNRGDLWADGKVQILRSSWTRDPAGQPAGNYVVFDFLGYRPNGDMDCGFIAAHQPFENSEFSIVRTEANYVAAEFMDHRVPQAEVLPQLPCFLGNVFSGQA
jgi:hypothetical protein